MRHHQDICSASLASAAGTIVSMLLAKAQSCFSDNLPIKGHLLAMNNCMNLHFKQKTASLSWPGLHEADSSDEEDNAPDDRSSLVVVHKAAGCCSNTGSNAGSPVHGAGSCGGTPARLSGLANQGLAAEPTAAASGAEELSKQLKSALQKDMSKKRAANGVVELVVRGRSHVNGPSAAGNSVLGDAINEGSMTGPCRSNSSSLSGMKRAVLNLKSVKAMPLSAAAKATIISTIADNALAAFVVIQVAISVSRLLKKYSSRADLNARMPDFRVQMGFGLHVGWAIEGAIGRCRQSPSAERLM